MAHLWAELDEHLGTMDPGGVGLRPLGRSGPSGRTFDHVLTRLLSLPDPMDGARDILGRHALDRGGELVDHDQVAELRRQLYDCLADLVRIRDTVARVRAHWRSCPKDWQDKVFSQVTQWVREGRPDDPADIAALAHQVATPTGTKLRTLFQDAELVTTWEQHLDRAWASAAWRRRVTATHPPGVARTRELVELLTPAPRTGTPDELEARFLSLVDAGEEQAAWWMVADRPVDTFLSARSPVEQPAVLPVHDKRALPLPLDRSIGQRLTGGAEKPLPSREAAVDVVDGEVERSAEPLGLGAPAHRALLCAALGLAAGVDVSESAPAGTRGSPERHLYNQLDKAAQVRRARLRGLEQELEVYERWSLAWVHHRLWSSLAGLERSGRPIATLADAERYFWGAVSSFVKDQKQRTAVARRRREPTAGPHPVAAVLAGTAPSGTADPQLVAVWFVAALREDVLDVGGLLRLKRLVRDRDTGDVAAHAELVVELDRVAQELAIAAPDVVAPTVAAAIDFLELHAL